MRTNRRRLCQGGTVGRYCLRLQCRRVGWAARLQGRLSRAFGNEVTAELCRQLPLSGQLTRFLTSSYRSRDVVETANSQESIVSLVAVP